MSEVSTATRTVLVTGAHSPLGRLVRRRLAGWRVRASVGRAGLDAVVHLDWDITPDAAEETFRRNVLGAMEAITRGVERGAKTVVVVSSIMVYGARPNNPHYLPETRRVRLRSATPYVRQLAELESYVGQFLDGRMVRLVVLRLAHVVGPTVDSPLMRYLRLRAPPVAMGFDAHLQLLHEEDASAAIERALESKVRGPVNVAADGIVPVVRLLRRLGRRYVPVFHPILRAGRKPGQLPFDASYLMFHCCGETRRMREELGCTPSRTADEVVEDLAARRRRGGH